MAKKKSYPIEAVMNYTPPPVPDNNPDGPYSKPDDDLNGCRYAGKYSFVDKVAKGESPIAPDVYTETANGCSRSRDEGKNLQYNYGEGVSGKWNKNRDWKGGNLSGL